MFFKTKRNSFIHKISHTRETALASVAKNSLARGRKNPEKAQHTAKFDISAIAFKSYKAGIPLPLHVEQIDLQKKEDCSCSISSHMMSHNLHNASFIQKLAASSPTPNQITPIV